MEAKGKVPSLPTCVFTSGVHWHISRTDPEAEASSGDWPGTAKFSGSRDPSQTAGALALGCGLGEVMRSRVQNLTRTTAFHTPNDRNDSADCCVLNLDPLPAGQGGPCGSVTRTVYFLPKAVTCSQVLGPAWPILGGTDTSSTFDRRWDMGSRAQLRWHLHSLDIVAGQGCGEAETLVWSLISDHRPKAPVRRVRTLMGKEQGQGGLSSNLA